MPVDCIVADDNPLLDFINEYTDNNLKYNNTIIKSYTQYVQLEIDVIFLATRKDIFLY
jgi:hypothetical protein